MEKCGGCYWYREIPNESEKGECFVAPPVVTAIPTANPLNPRQGVLVRVTYSPEVGADRMGCSNWEPKERH